MEKMPEGFAEQIGKSEQISDYRFNMMIWNNFHDAGTDQESCMELFRI